MASADAALHIATGHFIPKRLRWSPALTWTGHERQARVWPLQSQQE
jgi:hypothetical protein